MNNVEQAAGIIEALHREDQLEGDGVVGCFDAAAAAQALADAGHLTPDPQIIRTVDELEALDHDTVLLLADMTKQDAYDTQQTAHRDEILGRDFSIGVLPAAVLTPGAQVRAARTALQEDAE